MSVHVTTDGRTQNVRCSRCGTVLATTALPSLDDLAQVANTHRAECRFVTTRVAVNEVGDLAPERIQCGDDCELDELVLHYPAMVHLERLDTGLWHFAVYGPGDRRVALDIGLKAPHLIKTWVTDTEGAVPKATLRELGEEPA